MCLIRIQSTVSIFWPSAGLLYSCKAITFVVSKPPRVEAFGQTALSHWWWQILQNYLVNGADEADVPTAATSDDSFTTDDEDTAAVSGKQVWTMSFEWQDETVADASGTCTSFEESADFGWPLGCSHPTSTNGNDCEAAEPSPTDPDCDWIQPWSASPAGTASTVSKDQSQSYHTSKENQPKPTQEPMSDEHKTAILGKCQQFVA